MKIGLAFYALYRSKPTRFRLAISAIRLVPIIIEVESDGRRGELPPSDPTKD